MIIPCPPLPRNPITFHVNVHIPNGVHHTVPSLRWGDSWSPPAALQPLLSSHCLCSEGADTFSTLAAGVADELNLHRSYAAKWDVDLSLVRRMHSYH